MYLAIAEFFFIPFFSGFTIWSVVYLLSKRKQIAGYQTESIDNFIVRAVVFIGIIYFLIFSVHAYLEGIDSARAFGDHWFEFWIYPLTYFGFTQLLWFKKIQKNRIVRLMMSIWFFMVIYLETFMVLASTFHRDISEDYNSVTLFGFFALNLLITFLIFATLVVSGLEIKAWIRSEKP